MSGARSGRLGGEVLVVQSIHEAGLARLEAAGLTVRHASSPDMAVVCREIGDAVAVVTRSAGINAAAIRAGAHLRVIGNHGTGLDAIDLEAAAACGVRVVRTPGANAVGVAEMTLTLMLAVLKRVCEADRAARTGDGTFKYRAHLGDLVGSTVGIVGFGAVGRALAGMLRHAFDTRLLVHTRSPNPAALARVGAELVDIDVLAAESDVITLHRPSSRAGRPLVDASFLARMKPTAILVNTARGALVDEDALAAALSAGTIAGAGLDVFQEDRLDPSGALASAPNLVSSPHIAGSSVAALRSTAEVLAEALVDALLEGETVAGSGEQSV